MPSRRGLIVGVFVVAGCIAVAVGTRKGRRMSELRFHLGDNIHETAQRSGIPRFTVDKTGGLVAYYANVEIPAEIGLRYDRPSFEVVFRPLSQLDLWA